MQEISRKQTFQGRVFDVEQVTLRMPDNRQREYDLVVHRGAVVIVPHDNGDLLFVRQFRLGAGEALLELPAGVLESGESPEECARREIREETGMGASQWMRIGELFIAPGYCTEYQYIFLASDLKPAPLRPDSDEFLQLVRLKVEEAYQMAERGLIRDGKTLAALLLARPHLFSG